ncbi:MAG: tetratricopeptide repeat protein [Candidatus Hydrogenedentes bacterium]|nr:tetratricopeptide repeat protein [Candidatus Hydrogenedentota bacterium]
MALDKRKKKTTHEELLEQGGDLDTLTKSIQENPVAYGIALVFIMAVVAAGLLYRAHSVARDTDLATEYAQALENEEDEAVVAALEPVAESRGTITPHAVYMLGEAAFRSNDYDKARAAFERVRLEFPDSDFVPDAVEGLGFIAEAQGDTQTALDRYREILDNWPGSFTARRQQLNIGRVLEGLGNAADAVVAYREQVSAFPESHVAEQAREALDRLNRAHPELFEPPAVAEAPPAAEADAAASQPGDAEEPPQLKLSLPDAGAAGDTAGEPESDADAQ